MDYGYKITTHGRQVLSACLDLQKPLWLTRAAVGSGLIDRDEDLAKVHDLVQYTATASVVDRRHEGDRLFLTVRYCNKDHKELGTFTLSEFMVWAKDPETGQETDFLYATLGDFRQSVPGYSEHFPASVWSYPLVLVVSGELQVSITASPGLVTFIDLQEAVDRLKLEIMTNELTLPLSAASGEELLTSSGTPLLAVYHPNQSAAVLAELAALEGRMSGRIAETAAGLTADCAAASMRDRAYADGRVLALERAVDKKLEAQAADTEEQIQTAKAEAITTASEDAADQDEVLSIAMDLNFLMHNNSTNAHPDFLRASENTILPHPSAE